MQAQSASSWCNGITFNTERQTCQWQGENRTTWALCESGEGNQNLLQSDCLSLQPSCAETLNKRDGRAYMQQLIASSSSERGTQPEFSETWLRNQHVWSCAVYSSLFWVYLHDETFKSVKLNALNMIRRIQQLFGSHWPELVQIERFRCRTKRVHPWRRQTVTLCEERRTCRVCSS